MLLPGCRGDGRKCDAGAVWEQAQAEKASKRAAVAALKQRLCLNVNQTIANLIMGLDAGWLVVGERTHRSATSSPQLRPICSSLSHWRSRMSLAQPPRQLGWAGEAQPRSPRAGRASR